MVNFVLVITKILHHMLTKSATHLNFEGPCALARLSSDISIAIVIIVEG